MADDDSELKQLRDLLDAVDSRILDAVVERQEAIARVAALKAVSGLALRDTLREDRQLQRLGKRARDAGVSPQLVQRLFRLLLDHSLRFQQHHLAELHNPAARGRDKLVVAYQGTDGAYSQMAAENHFAATGSELETTGRESFLGILEAVRSGVADYAMLPVENTTAGSINEAYDLLAQLDLSIVGEEVLRVEHCLVALQGAELGAIRHVFSHPQALAQCSVFLSGLTDCTVEAFTDTAMSVERVRDEGNPAQAAVASARAASLYGLHVLAENIQNQRNNYTRFMVVAREPLRFDERIPCKTTLIFATRHEQGALVRCLNVLAAQELNLTKLESRPRPDSPFEYLFYVDFEGNTESAAVQKALDEMREHTSDLKVLGSYPAASSTRDQ